MENIHPCFVRVIDGDDFEVVDNLMIKGLTYWTRVFCDVIEQLNPDTEEIPVIVASLKSLADVYATMFPDTDELVDFMSERITMICK